MNAAPTVDARTAADRPVAAGDDWEAPLHGVRVADFTHMLAGPSAAMALADLGASVVKFEVAPRGDPARHIGTGGAVFNVGNRNKRSVVLNLKDRRAQQLALRYIRTCDVVLESLRPGVMEGWGLGFDAVSALVPGIVYGSVVGFGSQGPDRDRGGVDLLLQAESGMMNLSGAAGGPPTKAGFQLIDTAAGLALAQAVAAALYKKARTGRGSKVEVRLLDTALYLQSAQIAEFSVTGSLPQPTGNANPLASPADLFATSDGHLVIAAFKDDEWVTLCNVLGLERAGSDPRYRSHADRLERRAEVAALLVDRLRQRTTEEWYRDLRAADLLVARVRNYRDIVADPQVAVNGALIELSTDRAQPVLGARLPYVLDDRTGPRRAAVPHLGADTLEVMAELGVDHEELQCLLHEGVIVGSPGTDTTSTVAPRPPHPPTDHKETGDAVRLPDHQR